MEEKNSRNLNFGPHDAIMQMWNTCANSISRLYDCQHRILTETIKVLTKDAFLTEKTLPSPLYGVFPVPLGQFTSLGLRDPKRFGRAE